MFGGRPIGRVGDSRSFLQDAVRRQSDRVFGPLGFEEVVNFWIGETCVRPKIDARDLSLVALDNRLEHALPAVRRELMTVAAEIARKTVSAVNRLGARDP